MTRTMKLPAQECKVIAEVDVLVVGGGATGIGAAVGAAQNGAKTALVEHFGALGGTISLGYVTSCEGATAISGDKILIKGVFHTMVERMAKQGAAIRGWELAVKNKYYPFDASRCENDLQITSYDPDYFKMTADTLMRENNVKVFFYTMVTNVIKEGNKLTGVVIENKGGRQIILAQRIVDATGDGTVGRLAGVEMKFSSAVKNGKGPLTLMFRAGGVKNVTPSYKPNVKEIPYGAVNFFPLPREGEFRFEMTRYSGNGTDPDDLTNASMECRKQCLEVLDWLKKNWCGFEDAYFIDSASLIGSLAYPKVVGVKTLTKRNVLDQYVPDDTVALTAYGFDIHSQEEGGQNSLQYMPLGTYYGIPYGVMVPKTEVENLLIAGRNGSTEDGAESCICNCGISMALGEAAGTASAVSLQDNVTSRDVDVDKVRDALIKHGQILEPEKVPPVERYYVYTKQGE
jgi:2-polyprenyl-6-methoxyphenol hydroxylase-like FAD-dependent oxidoreductase